VCQDARDVKTKFSKTFVTYFFPVGDEPLRIVAEWVAYLRQDGLWGNDDPLFPATKVEADSSRRFRAVGLKPEHWSNGAPIRTIFRDSFRAAGLPYYNPHSFRDTLVRLGETVCRTPEQFKAWSQNLGHEGVLTTFYSYGQVPAGRQGEIIRSLAGVSLADDAEMERLADALARRLSARVVE
jgi:hypothetical protein